MAWPLYEGAEESEYSTCRTSRARWRALKQRSVRVGAMRLHGQRTEVDRGILDRLGLEKVDS